MGPSGLLPFHEVGRTTLLSRFTELSEVLTCATLTNYPSTSHGAYAWVQCKEGVDCLDYLAKVNLIAEPGTQFGSTSQCKMCLCSANTDETGSSALSVSYEFLLDPTSIIIIIKTNCC